MKHVTRMEPGRARALRFAVTVIGLGILAGQMACYRRAQHDNTSSAIELPRDTIHEEHQSSSIPPNYPNPFSAGTIIHLKLDKPSEVVLKVYNVNGDWVRTLCSTFVAVPGDHDFSWSGVDASGDTVPSGIYFYQLKANDSTMARKMTILR